MAEPSQAEPWVELLPLCRANEAHASLFTKRVVSAARDAGASWAAIGRGFGVTRQAAMRRYGGTFRLSRLRRVRAEF